MDNRQNNGREKITYRYRHNAEQGIQCFRVLPMTTSVFMRLVRRAGRLPLGGGTGTGGEGGGEGDGLSRVPSGVSLTDNDTDNGKRKTVGIALPVFLMCGLLAMLFAFHNTTPNPSSGASTVAKKASGLYNIDIQWAGTDGSRIVVPKDGASGENTPNVGLGPHRLVLTVEDREACPVESMRIYMRLIGTALVSIPLLPESEDPYQWTAEFSIPEEGMYSVETWLSGCKSPTFNSTAATAGFSINQGWHVKATGKRNENGQDGDTASGMDASSIIADPSFAPGVWLSKDKFVEDKSTTPREVHNEYVWMSKKGIDMAPTSELVDIKSELGETTVVLHEPGTVISKRFNDLSNYELVCWIGNTTALREREAFLGIKDKTFVNQRKFKFHHYPTWSLAKPDTEWSQEGFLKCKNILVTLDEFEVPLSQHDYKIHVAHFVKEVTEAIKDDTFPVWVLTMNRPTTDQTMCFDPSRKSPSHPCNDALKDIFANREKYNVPSRVNLIDNTDLQDPQFDDTFRKDLIGVVALRIMAVVGRQVGKWRDANQKGIKDGLMRKGVLEPNQPKVLYTFTEPDMKQ